MTAIVEILAALLLLAGAGIAALAALGVARLPDPFMRMHAATKAGVAGAGLLLLGAGLAIGTAGALLTALVAVAFLVLTTPLAAHALGRAAYVAGAPVSAATVADALAGVLDRKVFDIDPARMVRPRPAPQEPLRKETAMSAVPEFRRPSEPSARRQPQADPAALRRILCCLVGGRAQREATAEALQLARATGAQLVGLSGAGLQPQRLSGPMPIGGAFWAEWLAARSRARIREICAAALEEFQSLAADAPDLEVISRHEEADAASLARLLAGHDLVVLPAGAGPHGHDCEPGDEIAASVARARIAPVLRVRRRPGQVRAVLLVAGDTAGCGGLAAGLLRSGLWPHAAIAILPAAEGPGVAAMAEAQAGLLRAHGRQVAVLPPLERDFDRRSLRAMLTRFDAAVMSRLSGRQGGFLDSLRACPFETAAETAPLALLP